MPTITIRFYADLNDFLEPWRRQLTLTHDVAPRTSVKDAIESLGVPHTEVDFLLVNGEPATFGCLLEHGDRVAVYPAVRALDLAPVSLVHVTTLDAPRFVLDGHLGRLAAYLRMTGFDALYRPDYGDPELARISSSEDRVLLTRDVGLLKRSQVRRGYWVRGTAPARQLLEVLRRFDLVSRAVPFSRCLRCNSLVEPVARREVVERLPLRVRERGEELVRCPACGRVYWKGSHYEWMQRMLAAVLRRENETG
jgi:hypothetical protein